MKITTWTNKPHLVNRRIGIQFDIIPRITTGIYIDYWFGQRVIRISK